MLQISSLRRVVWGAYLAGALFIAGVLIYTLDRGLDLWDEGFNLAYVDAPDRFFFRFSFFDFLVDRAFFWMDHTVVNYRRVSVLLAVVSALVFANGFWRWLRARMELPGGWLSAAFVASLCLLANLLYFAHFPRAVQYNNLNAFFVIAATGLILTLLSFRDDRPPRDYALLAGGTGLLTAGIFFVKFTSLPPFGLLVAFTIVTLLGPVSLKRRLVALCYLAGGFCLGVGLFFLFILSPAQWWSGFSYSIGLELENAHKGSRVLRIYWKDVLRYAANFGQLVPVVLLWVGTVVSLRVRKKPLRGARYLVWAVALGGAAYLGWRLYGTAFVKIRLPEPFLFIPLALVPVVAALVPLRRRCRNCRHVLGVAAFLFAMPFAGSFGTANGIVFGTLPYLVGMAAVTVIVGLVLENAARREGLSMVSLVLFLVLSMHTTYSRLVYLPRNTLPVSKQTERVEGLPKLQGLYVSEPLNEYLKAVRSVLETDTLFEAGDPVMFVYDHPSVVYGLGGTSPGMPWYFFHRDALNCAVFSGAVKRREFDATRMVILTLGELRPPLRECLSTHGIEFPDDFAEVASIEYGGAAKRGPARTPRTTGGRRRRLRLKDEATRIFVPPSMLRKPRGDAI